jgi:hypothetical protein
MRERIFDPILNTLFDRLDDGFFRAGPKRYILFSGVLGECPYTHTYMKNRFGNIAEILGTSDE